MTSKSAAPLFKLWLTFAISLLSITGFSQDHVTMTLKNVSATSTTVDFDMFIVNDGTTALKLAACSFGVNYNASILNGGTPANGSFTFIAGTRDAGLTGLNTYTVAHTLARNHLRTTMSPQAEGSAPTLAPNVEYRIGTFRFTNTVLWTTNGNPAFALQLVLAAGYTQCVATVYSNGNTVTNSLNTTGALPAGNISGTVISSIILNPAATCAVTGSGTTTAITCAGGTNGTANITLTGTGSGAPGTYTVDGGSPVAFATNPFTVGGLSAGNHTIVATVTAGGCVSSDIIVNVGGPTSANANAGVVSGNTSLCAGALTTFFSNGDAGGTWSSTNTTVATVNASTGIVTGLSAGSTDITYTVSVGCNAPVSSFKTLTVTGSATLAAVAGGAQVCINAAVQPAATQPSGTTFTDGSCNVIATVLPSGLVPVTGNINTCVRVEDVVHTYHNLPYVQRVYDIMPATNGANATATLTLYYTQAEFDAYNVARGIYPPLPTGSGDAAGIANILITQFHGTGTFPGNYNGGVVDLINPTDTKVVFNNSLNRWEINFDVNGFSGFYLHTSLTNTPLPISLLSFSGYHNSGYNLLQWATSSEQNSSYFELQRSTDGINFIKASSIPAAGNSSTVKNYGYSDNITGISANIFYYRLMQVDISGQVKYSTIVKIRLSVKGFNVDASPNPFADQLRIQIDAIQKENAVITLNSLDGKKLMQTTASLNKGSNAVLLDKLGYLPGGVYLVTVVTDTEKITVKVIKQQ